MPVRRGKTGRRRTFFQRGRRRRRRFDVGGLLAQRSLRQSALNESIEGVPPGGRLLPFRSSSFPQRFAGIPPFSNDKKYFGNDTARANKCQSGASIRATEIGGIHRNDVRTSPSTHSTDNSPRETRIKHPSRGQTFEKRHAPSAQASATEYPPLPYRDSSFRSISPTMAYFDTPKFPAADFLFGRYSSQP